MAPPRRKKPMLVKPARKLPHPKRPYPWLLALALSFAPALSSSSAVAAERAGIQWAESVKLEGKTLALNGTGVRHATILRIKVYVAALYLERKTHSASEVIKSEQTKRLDLVLLRDVSRSDIVDVWRKGMQKNGADLTKLKPRFDKLVSWMPDLNKGDRLSFLYVPGSGTTVSVKGQRKGTLEGSDFAAALFAVWFGPEPADGDLKSELLGQ
ncbi:MAG TPA: chalcone isomerase family protein [Polyangiaceae bacterium]|nr:chalcone isomerase family protein [Polyangiaceae bacterium]